MYEEIRSRRLLPESWGYSGRLLLKVHCGALESMAPSVAVVLGSSLALRGLRRRPGDSCGHRGGYCGRYRPPCLTWRCTEGPADGGLTLVKVRTSSEDCVHACRGFCSRERYGKLAAQWQEQCQARPHRVSQVPTGSEQCQEWRNSDRSWRTGLRSQLLCGMVA